MSGIQYVMVVTKSHIGIFVLLCIVHVKMAHVLRTSDDITHNSQWPL